MRYPVSRLAALALLAGALALPAVATPKVGSAAPAFSGKTTAGKTLKSSDYKGKALLVNFFSAYCDSCHEEYPHLQELQEKYGPKGLQVISVSFDAKTEEAGRFAKEFRVAFPVIHDPKRAVFKKLGVELIPANVAINKQGKIVAIVEEPNIAAIEAAAQKALK